MGNLRFDFSGKRALITGGASGIGLRMAEDFLAAGAAAAVWDVSEGALQRLRSRLPSARLEVYKADVSSPDQCRKAAAALKGPIDFLINNAGILKDRSLAKMTEGEYQAVMQTCLSGMFFAAKALLPCFYKDERSGKAAGRQRPLRPSKRIINISSISGIYGNFGQTSYAAAKAGAIAFVKVWARELARKGFTVNAIAPGFIQTGMLESLPAEVMEKLAKKIPAGRTGAPEDVSRAALFLCSEEAAYINGAVLEVSGGAVL